MNGDNAMIPLMALNSDYVVLYMHGKGCVKGRYKE
jgi:hypothetical protein